MTANALGSAAAPAVKPLAGVVVRVISDALAWTERHLLWLLVGVDLLIALVRWGGSKYQAIFHHPIFNRLDSIKFLDPLLVTLCIVLVVAELLGRRGFFFPRRLLFAFLALALIMYAAAVGIVYRAPGLYYALQAVIFYIRPILVWLIFTAKPVRPAAFRAVLRAMFLFGLLSSLLVFYQYFTIVPLRSADLLTGLFDHSHAHAMFVYSLVLLLLGSPEAIPNQAVRWAGMGIMLSSGYLARNDKATFLLLLIIIGAIVIQDIQRRRMLRLIFSASIVMTLVLFAFSQGTTGFKVRRAVVGNLELLLRGYQSSLSRVVGDIGLVQMVGFYAQRSAQDPLLLLFGFGPGNFGSPSCLTKVAAGKGEPWQQSFFHWDTDFTYALGRSRLQALSYHTSLVGAVLGELGLLAIVPYLLLILWPLLTHGPSGGPASAGRLHFWSKAAYCLVLAVSVIATSSSAAWENELVVTLIMAGFGASYALAKSPDLRLRSRVARMQGAVPD